MQSMQIKQILFLLIILLAFLIIFGFLIYTSMANAIASEEISPIKRKLIKYENSDITIDADEVIDGTKVRRLEMNKLELVVILFLLPTMK